MIYRPIGALDVGALTEFALSALPTDGLVVSRRKVRDVVQFFATNSGHFNLAAFDGRRPVAGVAAVAAEMPFHEGREAAVMFCYSKHPGAGMHVLSEMMRWFHADPTLKRIRWDQNADSNPRIPRIAARRLGMTETRSAFMLIKEN